jgi:hypothetical protein
VGQSVGQSTAVDPDRAASSRPAAAVRELVSRYRPAGR